MRLKSGNALLLTRESFKGLGDSLSPFQKPKDIDTFGDLFDDPDVEEDKPLPEDPVDADGRAMFESPVTDLLLMLRSFFPKGTKFSRQKFQDKTGIPMGSLLALMMITLC